MSDLIFKLVERITDNVDKATPPVGVALSTCRAYKMWKWASCWTVGNFAFLNCFLKTIIMHFQMQSGIFGRGSKQKVDGRRDLENIIWQSANLTGNM